MLFGENIPLCFNLDINSFICYSDISAYPFFLLFTSVAQPKLTSFNEYIEVHYTTT